MRRLWCVLVAVVLLVAGCRPSAAEPQSAEFSCTVEATYRELNVKGTLTRYGAGTLALAFDEPETLNGLTVRWDGEAITLSLHGLEFTADAASVPESALGTEIVAALDAALRGEGERREAGGVLTVNGSGPNGAYTLTFDAQSGVPLALSVPSLPLTVTFSEVMVQ